VSITRPRLLRAMLARWEHRVTAVTGGAGLGKTTLLAQSIAENRLAPRGEDVWLGLQPSDAEADSLARDALVAAEPDPADDVDPTGLGGTGGAGLATGAIGATSSARAAANLPPDPRAVADAVWRRAPRHVCLVLDNAHLVPAESAGGRWLSELVEALPANGHLVLSSRGELPIPVARLAAAGELLRVTESELRFTSDEVAGFAERHDVDPAVLARTGGWPALAELAATVEADLTEQYLWEEVLRPLGDERLRALAVLTDLGGADDDLASAALGHRVALEDELAGVPLVAVGADGWRAPHALWDRARRLELAPDERAAARRRAAAHLTGQRRYDEAITLAHEGGLDDLLPDVLRGACARAVRPTVGELERWLDLSPPEVHDSTAGKLAAALLATLADPHQSAGPLREAAKSAREDGDLDAELVAIANLGRVGWWYRDLNLVRELIPRVGELSASGHPGWQGLAACGRGVFADLAGDDATAIAEIDSVPEGALDEGWEATIRWLAGNILAGRGDAEGAAARLAQIPRVDDPNLALTIVGLQTTIRWLRGEVDEVATAIVTFADEIRASGLTHNLGVAVPAASLILAYLGDLAGARGFLADAHDLDDVNPVSLRIATAAVRVAEGDEEAATAELRAALAESPIGLGTERRLWRQALALSYVLLPETRADWDAADLRGTYDTSRRLAAAVVAVREGAGKPDAALRTLALPAPGVTRAVLPFRFAADLAVGLEAAGNSAGATLLDAVGPPGRSALRQMAGASSGRRAKPARTLLAAVPAPPPAVTDLGVLGPLALWRGGEEVTGSDLRRERVRALLAFLVGHRRTTRAEITAALWPDLDDQAAGNNLRVTLTYLLRVLEPWRAAGEPSFHVRTSGQRVELVTGDHLRVDADRFDEHLAAAGRAEADGTPSLALEHDLAAVALYRGDLYAGVEAEWVDLDRDHFRQRMVAAATRAGQLLAARGDIDEADDVARRAIAADAWAEHAYAVLATTALARNDRVGARQALDRCMAALADLGVDPSDETQRLRRRLRTSG
jgi:LuxR family maltose regulon positive regulatory protein